jgi:glycosyltransferase involved in cell wall biosynthesis
LKTNARYRSMKGQREDLIFVSHNPLHQRNRYLLNHLRNDHHVLISHQALSRSDRLSLSAASSSNMLQVGTSAYGVDVPVHLDGIDVFIYPFIRNREILFDYHVPLVDELRWLGLYPLAALARMLQPSCIRGAKVIIAPNQRMLAHASKYARVREHYLVPNYPPASFHSFISQREAREKLGIATDNEMILFVGGARLREIYGIDLLMRAWSIVRRRHAEAQLYVVGPLERLGLQRQHVTRLKNKGLFFVGQSNHRKIAEWIAAADVCISQRTPGFPSQFYDMEDSIKLSEYALFEKPIVAAGYAQHPDYIQTETTPDEFAGGIFRALEGEAPRPVPHTWEENEPVLRRAYESLLSG